MTVDSKTGVDTAEAERLAEQYRDFVHKWFDERASLNAVLVALGMELTRLLREGRASHKRVEKLRKGLEKLRRSAGRTRPVKPEVDRMVEQHRRLVGGWVDQGVGLNTILFTIGTVIYGIVRQCMPQREADGLLMSVLELINSTETMKAAMQPDRVGAASSAWH